MKARRDFLKLSILAGATGGARAIGLTTPFAASSESTGAADRAYWLEIAGRLAAPVLDALSRRRLKAEMPVEMRAPSADRAKYTHLEALGRLVCGFAPWLELAADSSAEGRARARYAELALAAVDAATDPASPDFMNFSKGAQPVVDAAFLAQGLLRAPTELWNKLEPRVKANVIAALKSTRVIQPGENNWKLFATTIEVFLQHAGESRNNARLFDGIAKYCDWYLGDGVYGDGPEFHCDYYNSFVIQPMLVEALEAIAGESPEWQTFRDKAFLRLTRWAAIQERLIAPDGSYPPIGRSLSYRCGAFQGLALAALRHILPEGVSPGQARRGLTSVIRHTLGPPETWDAKGWLRIGLAGHQPGLGESYISTGSLYLCSVALLPLGLPPTDLFWTAQSAPTTSERAWAGIDNPADHALAGK